MEILLAGTHAAAGQYIKALWLEMRQRGHCPTVTLAGAAAELLKGQIPFIQAEVRSAAELLATIKPDHLCCCIAGVPAENPWEMQLATEALQMGIPWTGHEENELSATLKTLRPLWLKMNPAKIFVVEQTSLDGLAALGVPEEKIMVIGNPTWDELAGLDLIAIKAKIRQQLKLRDNERLIVWLAPKTKERTREEWGLISTTFNRLTKEGMRLVLAAYFHPGCPDWKNTASADKPHGLYQEDLAKANFRILAGVTLNRGYDRTEVVASADLLISFFSTMTYVAAMLGVPTIRPFTGTNLAAVANQNRPPSVFRLVATGCQIAVRRPEDWYVQCYDVLWPNFTLLNVLRQNCAHHYPCGGNYAARIVQEIEKLH